MKKLTTKALIILASFICFYACSDKDDNSKRDEDNDLKKEVISLKQSKLETDLISVSWDKIEGAAYYSLKILKDNKPLEDAVIIEKGDDLKFSAKELLANTKYTIKIEAGNSFINEKIIAEGQTEFITKSLPKKINWNMV